MISDEMKAHYKNMFGRPLDDDLPHIKYMVRNFVSMGNFTTKIGADYNKVSMDEIDFAKVAFLAMVALGEVKTPQLQSGANQLEPSNTIDVPVTK